MAWTRAHELPTMVKSPLGSYLRRVALVLSPLIWLALVACVGTPTQEPPAAVDPTAPGPSAQEPTAPAAEPSPVASDPESKPPIDLPNDAPPIEPDNAWSLKRFSRVPGSIYFSPDMRYVRWYVDDEIVIFDVEHQEPVLSFPKGTSIVFSPDGQRLAWIDAAGSLFLRDLTSNAEAARVDGTSADCCSTLSFSPDGSKLLVVDRDEERELPSYVRVLDLDTDQELFSRGLYGSAEFSPGGNSIGIQEDLLTGVTLWDLGSSENYDRVAGFDTAAPIYGVTFAPDWSTIAFYARAGGELLDVSTGNSLFEFIGIPLGFTPDGQTLLASEEGWLESSECTGSVCLYDVESGLIRGTIPEKVTILDLTMSPSGKLLATHGDSSFRLWDLARAVEARMPVDVGTVKGVKFSPDGRLLLVYVDGQETEDWTEIWAVDPTVSTTRIQFDPGATTWTTEFDTDRGDFRRYELYALGDQVMQVFVTGQGTDFDIRAANGTVLTGNERRKPFWRGVLPSSQDYRIELRTADRDWVENSASLSIAIAPRGQDSQTWTYSDPDGQFTLEYSDYFALDPEREFLSMSRGDERLRLTFVGTDFMDGTNLEGAFVSVARSDDPEIVADCLTTGEYERDLGRATINDQLFSRSEFSDGGMGRFYNQTTYRTVYAGSCYEIALLEDVRTIGHGIPNDPRQEFDREGLLELMREVLFSLEFTG